MAAGYSGLPVAIAFRTSQNPPLPLVQQRRRLGQHPRQPKSKLLRETLSVLNRHNATLENKHQKSELNYI